MYKLRPYQVEASNAAVDALTVQRGNNGILILPTGAGKSLIIADIASRINTPLLVLQPSKEILEQNYAKLRSYGINAGIYSASVGRKEINRITFAMIGSVMNHKDYFLHFKHVIIDECHLVNSKEGMYQDFISSTERRVVGLTATPYRLYSYEGSAILKFITRTRPRIFKNVLYYCQIADLLKNGYLAKLKYYDVGTLDMRNVRSNSTGRDYSEASLTEEYERSDFYNRLVSMTHRLLHPKSGIPRKGILVFTNYIKEAQYLVDRTPNSAIVTGETKKKDREPILEDFKAGRIQVVANVGTLTTGFDYPELDTILLARPTKSLALYYQMVGRAIRPYEGKDGWIVDMCGNVNRFGKVEDLHIELKGHEKWVVTSNGRELTNVYF